MYVLELMGSVYEEMQRGVHVSLPRSRSSTSISLSQHPIFPHYIPAEKWFPFQEQV